MARRRSASRASLLRYSTRNLPPYGSMSVFISIPRSSEYQGPAAGLANERAALLPPRFNFPRRGLPG
jgi:hypothetical protein